MEKKELSTGELIELARACMERGDCFNCVLYNTQKCEEALILSLADRLEALCRRWVSVAEAKPAEADEYLVMIAGAKKPTVLHYDPNEEAFFEEGFDGEAIWYPVTHWAELPNGPSGTPVPTKEAVKRCATCRHEDKLAECDRCIACEKHNLWEQR